ncbi:MAG: hypothetical protein ACREJ2_13365 [Planctomycetota bacterium]
MAIVIVIMILAAMLAVIAPFVLSMTQTTKVSSTYLEESRARQLAEGGDQAGRAWVAQTDPMLQIQATKPPFNQPNVTTLDMLNMQLGGLDAAQKLIYAQEQGLVQNGAPVLPQPPGKDDPFTGLGNPQGEFLDVGVTDEQSKLNINTVPCRVLGNLLASALATMEVDSTTTSISVDDSSQFYDDGNPNTVDGYIAIDGVARPYLSASGNVIVLAQPFDQGMKFPPNSLVYDGRAELIRQMRNQREFQSVYELRDIGTQFGPSAVIRPQEFERILPFLTAHSFRSAQWTAGTRILDRSFSGDSYGLRVEDPRGFDAQCHVAIFDSTDQGEVQVGRPEGYIVSTNRRPFFPQLPRNYQIGFVNSLGFDETISDNNHYLWLRTEIPHPININTASWDVLKAMVKGIPSSGGYQQGAVDEQMADAFATAVVNARKQTPIDSHTTLFGMLDSFVSQNILPSDYIQMIKQSMVADRQGMQCAAQPVCFQSYYDYTVESHAREFDPSRNLRAQAGVIETFRIPARFPGLWYVDSQSQWEIQAALNGQGSGWVIGPRFVPYSGTAASFYANVYPYFSDLTPDYTNLQPNNGQIFTEVEFGMQGRHDFAYDNFENPAPDVDMMMGKQITGPIELNARGGVNQLPAPPIVMAGWFFPSFGMNGNEIFYSGDPSLKVPRDCIRLTSENGLTLYVTDSTGQQYLYNYPHVKLAPLVWHYIYVSATGVDPAQVFLAIDGKPVTDVKLPTQFLQLATAIPDQFPPVGVDPTLAQSVIQLTGDTSSLPPIGTIQIGQEIIDYNGLSGNTLQQCLRGRRFTTAVAHQGGEPVQELGFSVKLNQPYIGGLNGHLVPMQVNGASVGLPGSRPACSVNVPPPASPPEIDGSVTTIPITAETADKMPDYGFAILDYAQRTVGGLTETRPAELIWYSSRDATHLNNVVRGMYGSLAGKHWNGCRIYNAFVEATNLNGYLPPAGQNFVVQVDNAVNPATDVEWIQYSTIYTMNGHSYLASPPNGPAFGNTNLNPGQSWISGIWDRGVYDTAMATHLGTEKLILVRAVNMPWLGQEPYVWDPTYSQSPLLAPKLLTLVPGMYIDPTGQSTGNEVFLTEANNPDKLEHFNVKRAWFNHPWKDGAWIGGLWLHVYHGRYGGPYLVGLDGNPKYDYPTSDSRMLRSPVPEFDNSQYLYHGMVVNRNKDMQGYVDELKYGSSCDMVDGTVYTDSSCSPLPSSATTIQIQDATGQAPPPTGLAQIGTEIVYYDNLTKGAGAPQILNPFPTLNTPTGPPDNLQAKMDNLPQWNGTYNPSQVTLGNVQRGLFGTTAQDWPAGTRVRVLTTFFASSAATNAMSNDISLKYAADLPLRGFVSTYDQSGQIAEVVGFLARNNTLLAQSGTLRNRYGSGQAGLGGNAIYLWQPVRHEDLFMPSLSEAGAAYFPLQHRMEGGLWEGVNLDMVDYQPGVRANDIQAVVVARFDGAPGWDAPITNRPGGLYLFNLNSGANHISFPDSPVHADQLELRVMQRYLPGAIDTNDWKLSLVLGRVRFLVHAEGQTYRRDLTQ